jgi:hypothetical protein
MPVSIVLDGQLEVDCPVTITATAHASLVATSWRFRMVDPTGYTLDFTEIRMSDLARVGGKNASLGEMFNALKPKSVGVTDGFATTAAAYWRLLDQEGLKARLQSIFSNLNVEDAEQLAASGHRARAAVLETPIPQDIREAVLDAYDRLCLRVGSEIEVAVRSSATAEDLPEASFAGAAETYLNVRGKEALLRAVHSCYASSGSAGLRGITTRATRTASPWSARHYSASTATWASRT